MHCILQNCHLQDELDEAKWHIYSVFLTSHMYDCGCKQQQSEYACEKWQMLLLLCVCTSMYERIGKISLSRLNCHYVVSPSAMKAIK